MATEKRGINIGYQTKEPCPFKGYCFMNHKSETCLGWENYKHCFFYKEALKYRRGSWEKRVQKKLLSHLLLERNRKKLDIGRTKYIESLAKKWVNDYPDLLRLVVWSDYSQKSVLSPREEVVNL